MKEICHFEEIEHDAEYVYKSNTSQKDPILRYWGKLELADVFPC